MTDCKEVLTEVQRRLKDDLAYVEHELSQLEESTPPPAGAGEKALSADSFVQGISLNTHINWRSTVWGQPAWRDLYNQLGVRVTRTAIGTNKAVITDLKYIGAKAICIVCDGIDKAQASGTLDTCAANPDLIAAIEGPNEQNYNDPADWETKLRDFTQWLHTEVQARAPIRDKPILAPSIWGSEIDAYNKLGDIGEWIDGGNLHYYTGGNKPTITAEGDDTAAATTIDEALINAGISAPGLPIWVTETGWGVFGPGCPISQWYVTPNAQAKYCLRTLAEFFNRKVPQTSLYTLIDDVRDPPRYHGMLMQDLSKRGPLFNALRDLIGLFSDPEPVEGFDPGSLEFMLTSDAPISRLPLMQRSDGVFLLTLWQDAESYNRKTFVDNKVPNIPAVIEFASPMATVRLHTPYNSNGQPFATHNNVSRVTPGVPDHLLVLEIEP